MTIEEISAKDRRLDSLAWLIKGGSPCGAVCFDGEDLLVAKNCNAEHLFITSLFDFLAEIANRAEQLAMKGKDESKNAYEKFREYYRERREQLFEMGTKVPGVNADESFKTKLKESLKKVSRSMRKAYLDEDSEKAFKKEVAEAIRRGFQFVRLPDSEGVHAEMKILNELLRKKKIIKDVSFYIGISKKCCRNCEKAIEALNIVKGSNVQNVIAYRAKHANSYRSAIPPFLNKYPQIRNKFLELVGVETLEEAFHSEKDGKNRNKEDHSRSSSHRSSESWVVVHRKRRHKTSTAEKSSGEWQKVPSKNGRGRNGLFESSTSQKKENFDSTKNRRQNRK